MPAEVMEIFNRTGIAHLLAISGAHVGMVALALIFPISWRHHPSVFSNKELLQVTFLDVDQGDSVFLLSVGKTMMVDEEASLSGASMSEREW